MKLGILADMHLGYARFDEDALVQAEHALKNAEEKADVIIIAGDIFDLKTPKLETLKKAIDIFRLLKKPVYLTHGNHERRSKDMVNPLEFVASLSHVHYCHGKTEIIIIGNEKVSLTWMGSVPEEFAKTSLKKILEEEIPKIPQDAFKILVIHQSIKELVYGEENEISFDDLLELPFELIISGHVHQHHEEMDGKLLIPGSTVITQLRYDEQGERGYILYDTQKKKAEFITIPCRLYFYKELNFENASFLDIKESLEKYIAEKREKYNDAILKIKLGGTLKPGLTACDISFAYRYEGIYIQNNINMETMGERIRNIRGKDEQAISILEGALKKMSEKLKGKISFNSAEFFEKIAESADAGAEYLKMEKN